MVSPASPDRAGDDKVARVTRAFEQAVGAKPRGERRPPITIEGTAWEAPPAGAIPEKPADKAPSQAAAPPPRFETKQVGRNRYAGLAATIVLGIGGGIGVGMLLTHEIAERNEVAALHARLAERLASIEKPTPSAGAGSVVAAIGDVQSSIAAARIAAETRANQLGARLDQVERDTAARLEKLEKTITARDATSTINNLPPPPAPPAPVVAGKDPSESTPPQRNAANRKPAPGGWILREVHDGIALLESPRGWRQVLPGDYLPGAGRVVRVERRSGQWVVVTSGGVIDNDIY